MAFILVYALFRFVGKVAMITLSEFSFPPAATGRNGSISDAFSINS